MESDEALMLRAQHGDARATDELIARWRLRLHAFLARRARQNDADDLFQETWLRVVRARDRFDTRQRFSTWLFSIANNLCRDQSRRLAVRTRDSHAPPIAAPPLSTELRIDVRRRLATLPDRLREVLVLRYFEDLSDLEIAAVVGVPAGTVKSRLHTAVRALRGEEPLDV